MGSDNYDLSDLEDVLLPWAADLRISDAALADLCRQLASKLLDTSHGEALVSMPTEGLVVRGACDLETRHAMWWRGVLLETGQDVFDAQAEFGSRWSAEYLAILDGFKWADETQYFGPIWTSCDVVLRWWQQREFLCERDLPQDIRERIASSLTLRWPVQRLQLWNPGWGANPADFPQGMASTEPAARRKFKSSSRRRRDGIKRLRRW